MRYSKFYLCPQGFGRTIRVYLDDDIPWMPSSTNVLRNLSFSTNLESLPTLINELGQHARLEQTEQEIEWHIDGCFFL
jgi:hypothetical protein